MPDWIANSLVADVEINWLTLLVRLWAALIFGCLAAGVYRVTQQWERDERASLVPTLVLLTVIIAMVTMAIGNSVAQAFSLVGALSIVRFRTVVEDTRDTAFVIFAVAVGLAIGAGLITIPLLGVPVVALAAFLFRRNSDTPNANAANDELLVRIGIGQHPDDLLKEIFAKYLDVTKFQSAESARQGASLDLTYAVRLKPSADHIAFVFELNSRPTIQQVRFSRS